MVDIFVESITHSSKEIDAVFALPTTSLTASSGGLSAQGGPSTSGTSSGARHARATSSTNASLVQPQNPTVVIPKSSSVPSNMTLFDKKVDVSFYCFVICFFVVVLLLLMFGRYLVPWISQQTLFLLAL